MKNTSFIEAFKIGLGLIPSGLFRFVKKLIVVSVLYAVGALIPMAISFCVMQLLLTFDTQDSANMAFKILSTIGQIVPLSFSLYLSEYELVSTDEDSAELCFAICAVVIASLWIWIK